ncbi:hypothetical protein RDABS01_008052 [Bienertia sinuspersici]
MGNSPIFSLFSLLLLLQFLSEVSSSFTPNDHCLINCGSSSIIDSDNRKFLGDESHLSDSFHLSASRSISLTDVSSSAELYKSARIFTKPSKYAFKIKEKGAHLVRLHFHRFDSSKFDISDAQFHVLAGGYLLLNDFSGLTMKETEIKEYILWVDSDKLVISFKPSYESKFGFVNAIEVISAPKDLILNAAQFDGFPKNGFETMFRVNVGGINSRIKRSSFGGRIKYQNGGASREVAPDNVYNSARVIRSSISGIAKYELKWSFPIIDGHKYLVRTHFCDIASAALDLLYFNVHINGQIAMENLDLSTLTGSLASPFYADSVVNGGNGVITVSIRSSNLSSTSGVDALLNGIEVFKMSNSMDSFDGMISPKSFMRRCRGGNISFLVPLVAAVGLLVAASVVLRKRLMGVNDSVAWSRLPVDVSEVNMKVKLHCWSDSLSVSKALFFRTYKLLNQIRSDQTESDQINKMKLNQIRSDQTNDFSDLKNGA